MYNLGIYNPPWLSFVKSTLLSAGFGYVWRDQKIPRTLEYFKKVFKTRLKDQYLQTWTDDVASNAKCINYRMYKSDISLMVWILFLLIFGILINIAVENERARNSDKDSCTRH